MTVKYILVVHKSQKAEMLFRAEDGMMVAMRQDAVAVIGESPKVKDSRTFIDSEAAANWLRDVYPTMDAKLITKDEGAQAEIVETRDAESHGLYVPDGSLEMPGMAPHISRRN